MGLGFEVQGLVLRVSALQEIRLKDAMQEVVEASGVPQI